MPEDRCHCPGPAVIRVHPCSSVAKLLLSSARTHHSSLRTQDCCCRCTLSPCHLVTLPPCHLFFLQKYGHQSPTTCWVGDSLDPGGKTMPKVQKVCALGAALCILLAAVGRADATGEGRTTGETSPGNARTKSYRLVGSAKQECGKHWQVHVLRTTPVARQNREIGTTMDGVIGPAGSRPGVGQDVLPARPLHASAISCPANTGAPPPLCQEGVSL